MFYYTFLYFLAAAVICLALSILSIWVPKNRKRGRVLAGIAGGLTLAFLLGAFFAYQNRGEENFAHYDRIMSSEQITAITGDQRRSVSLELDPEGKYLLTNLEDRPVYAQEEDIRELCQVEFVKSGKSGSVTLRFCELENPGDYAEYAAFEYEGKYYCFLSEKLLYKNAFYLFNADYAALLIEALLT